MNVPPITVSMPIHDDAPASSFYTRKNRLCTYDYTLVKKLTHFSKVAAPGERSFVNPWLRIVPIGPDSYFYGLGFRSYIEVAIGYSWDGATGVPDVPGCILASGLHDPIYQFSEELRSVWFCREQDIIDFANKVFDERMLEDDCKVSTLYYTGVCIFGLKFHLIARWFHSHF